MKLYIKNMATLRCIIVVKDEIERVQLVCEDVRMGEATIADPVSSEKLELLRHALLKSGLEIFDDKKSRLVERIKNIVVEQVHYASEPLQENFSAFVARKLNYDYDYLSNLFATNQGMTLEHYIIRNKIEKVKELLLYEEMTIAQIALLMNYSSAAHLSNQFKKVTGFTATYFKKLKKIRFTEPPVK
ncbi:MAG: AraC family transcriptional regulator [Sphingobacteriales bacterium]|nr:MAG: AraC family transcriptional regulator [Sphingobacteriales bacterium]